jgi:hypothetical protein
VSAFGIDDVENDWARTYLFKILQSHIPVKVSMK